MINKIHSLRNFGCFQDFEWDESRIPLFQKVNIIYGYNGSGKTTLSNLFYLLSKNCLNKHELANEYLLENTSFKINTNIEITEKNYQSYDENLYVFNTKFINDHIYDGSRSNMDSFGISARITNESIDEIDEKLKNISLRYNKLIAWDKKLDNKINEIWNFKKNDFNSKIQGKRLTNTPSKIDSAVNLAKVTKKKLEQLYLDHYNLENIEYLHEQLKLIGDKASDIQIEQLNLEYFKNLLFEKVNVVTSGKLKNHIDHLKETIVNDNVTLDLNNWLIKGNDLLKSAKKGTKDCPLCMSKIASIIENLIADYDEYFNENLKVLLSNLDFYENQFITITEKIKLNEKKINEILVHLTPFKLELKTKFSYNKSKLKKLQTNILKLIQIKRNHPNSYVEFNLEVNNYFKDIEIMTQSIIDEVKEFIEIQSKQINELSKRDIIAEIKDALKKIAILEYNEKSNCIFETSKKSNSLIATRIQVLLEDNNKLIQELNTNREQEIVQLDAETRFVNIYLEYLGISKFIIKKQSDITIDNISIIYSANGIKKNSLKFSLSEGEKTALAFAFFLSKIRAEQLEGGAETFDNCIIVIDDPISSLDENRLFHTANLIDAFFNYNELALDKIPEQIFIFSHNINFLKYISNIFYSKFKNDEIEEYFIEPFTHEIKKIPNSLKNFTTTYLEKLAEIIKFKENMSTVTYDEAKKFIPNYIRIVLESFLSFKLALVNDDSNRLPGLNYLINKTIIEIGKFDEHIEIDGLKRKGIITRLSNLKKIADNESHGNIAKIESLNYISENELKDYCKHTLQIIRYLDEIHFTRAKSLLLAK